MELPTRIEAVDTHVCGEPGRVIVDGVTEIPGSSVFEKMQHLEREGDGLRKLMLREPRGYPVANCNLLVPSSIPGVDAGSIIMEQVEYAPMSGTNTIAVATVLVETDRVEVTEPVTKLTLESPAGLIGVQVEVADGKAKSVSSSVPPLAGPAGRFPRDQEA